MGVSVILFPIFLIWDTIGLLQVDAHNIVPCWITSDKQEYSARTIRKKIHDKLPKFLTKFPPVAKHRYTSKYKSKVCVYFIVCIPQSLCQSCTLCKCHIDILV